MTAETLYIRQNVIHKVLRPVESHLNPENPITHKHDAVPDLRNKPAETQVAQYALKIIIIIIIIIYFKSSKTQVVQDKWCSASHSLMFIVQLVKLPENVGRLCCRAS